jgi:hypothetical protein
MLRQYVQPAGTGRVAIQRAGGNTCHGGFAFQHLEPVSGDEDGGRGFVHAVIGAADPLQQAGHTFRRADLQHLVDAAPIDPEIERGGGDDGAESSSGHRGFDAAALFDVQAAVMDGDGEGFIVMFPDFLEHQLGLGAGVDEDDCEFGLFDPVQDRQGGGQAHMAGPGDALGRQEQIHHRGGAALCLDQPGGGADIGEDRGLVGDGGGQAENAGRGGEAAQAGEAEGELVAALGAGQGMDFINHDAAQGAEQAAGLFEAEQKREAFGGGEQDMGRVGFLACPAFGRGVAAAGFDADAEIQGLDRGHQVAGDVGGQRFQRADIEGVEPLAGVVSQIDQAGEKAGEGFAAAGRGDEERVDAVGRRVQHRGLMRAQGPAALDKPIPKSFWQFAHICLYGVFSFCSNWELCRRIRKTG